MANEKPDKVVNLSLNGSGLPVPDQDPVEVKKDSQKIKWCAPFQFTVDIDGYTDVKYSTGSGGCAFGAKTGNFASVKRYKYSITANGRTNDPDIDVKP